ncbi:DNA internalization-related competence protein ComEC/Rec2 [Sporolactobacillus sp. THM7-7]|nr:DNA internalization-related competence protein ComEC/Rec2 [Sporolactobacillus sp. THM7-7]
MIFSGKWHLIALFACLTAWAAEEQSFAPVFLLSVYALFLIFRAHYRLLAVLFAVVLILVLDNLFFQRTATDLSDSQTNFTGKMTNSPRFDGDRLTFLLRTKIGESVEVRARLPSNGVKQNLSRYLQPGMTCTVSGALEKPPKGTNFHAFDYRRYLSRHHIFWQLRAHGPPRCEDRTVSLLDRLKRFRQSQITRIQNSFSPDAAAMMNALIFGDDRELDPELESAYQLFGLVHLLVVSGMHVAVIFGILFFIAVRCGVIREHIYFLFLFFIPLYIILSGAEPSIIRAGLTAELFLIFRMLKKFRTAASDVLGMAGCFMVIDDPDVVFDLGFQLSFVVTFTLLMAAPQVTKRYTSPFFRVFILSVISELASFPIVAVNFYQMSLIGFLLNLFFIPFITFVILPLTMAAYFSCLILPAFCGFLSFVLDQLLVFPHRGLIFLYRHPIFQLNYGALSPLMLAAAVLIIFTVLLIWEKVNRFWTVLLLVLPFLILNWLVYVKDLANPYGTVTFLDVGQGDSILIRLPHRQGNVLIDSGGTIPYHQDAWQRKRKPFEVGRDVVLHELRAMGISSLDAVVLSHRDFDHIGGMNGIIGKMPIRKLIVSPYFDPDEKDRALFRKAAADGTKISILKSGDRFSVGETGFRVLSPAARSSSNDSSLVVWTVLGGKSWLFTGDLGEEGEQALLERYPDVRADILKLGHHGSRTSTSEDFLSRLRPSFGIISCGKNNRYGHPHPEVLQRLRWHHVRTMRTDHSGALQFSFSGSVLTGIRAAVSDE